MSGHYSSRGWTPGTPDNARNYLLEEALRDIEELRRKVKTLTTERNDALLRIEQLEAKITQTWREQHEPL